jgi:integrase/recombinase XerD
VAPTTAPLTIPVRESVVPLGTGNGGGRRRPTYLADRATRAELPGARKLAGPLLATASDRRFVPRASVGAGAPAGPGHQHPGLATTVPALVAGIRPSRSRSTPAPPAGLRRHKDPRTTRRYDHSRDSLRRNAASTVAAYLA